MLILKLEPTEASYTTSFMTLFTSLANMIQYLILGSILWGYSLASIGVGIIGFSIGLREWFGSKYTGNLHIR